MCLRKLRDSEIPANLAPILETILSRDILYLFTIMSNWPMLKRFILQFKKIIVQDIDHKGYGHRTDASHCFNKFVHNVIGVSI